MYVQVYISVSFQSPAVYIDNNNIQITFDLAAKETMVRCRSFFNCGGERAGSELALAEKKKKHVHTRHTNKKKKNS